MTPGSPIKWRDFDGELRQGRLRREEAGGLCIVDYASGSEGYDRTTVCCAADIIGPGEEKRRRKLAELDARQAAEVQRHQAELRLIAREREALQ